MDGKPTSDARAGAPSNSGFDGGAAADRATPRRETAAPRFEIRRLAATMMASELRPEIRAIADIHAQTITQGFLTRLGPRFLREVYWGIVADASSCVWIARAATGPLGFLAYTRNVGGMFRCVLRRGVFRLGFASFPAVLNPLIIKEMFDTLRYPGKQGAADLPPAEILSVGVSAEARGLGVGRELVELAVAQARADGETVLKVLAGAALDAANRFYPACGFTLHGQITQHGEPLNVYVRPTGV